MPVQGDQTTGRLATLARGHAVELPRGIGIGWLALGPRGAVEVEGALVVGEGCQAQLLKDPRLGRRAEVSVFPAHGAGLLPRRLGHEGSSAPDHLGREGSRPRGEFDAHAGLEGIALAHDEPRAQGG